MNYLDLTSESVGFFAIVFAFGPNALWSGLLGTVTKWKLATLSGSDAVNVAHSAWSLVQTRTKQSVDSLISSFHIILIHFRHIYKFIKYKMMKHSFDLCAFTVHLFMCIWLSECNQGTAQRSPQTRERRIRTHRSPYDAVCHAWFFYCFALKRRGLEQDAVLRRPQEAGKQSWFHIWKAFV